MGFVIGQWWGQYVLGLNVSYLEYYDVKMTNRIEVKMGVLLRFWKAMIFKN